MPAWLLAAWINVRIPVYGSYSSMQDAEQRVTEDIIRSEDVGHVTGSIQYAQSLH